MIREAIVKLVNKENLTYEMAEGAMDEIMGGKADPIQISAFLTAMTMKGETIEEITACANGMRKHGVHMEHDKDVLEIVGTGGDKSNSFNISTTASLFLTSSFIRTTSTITMIARISKIPIPRISIFPDSLIFPFRFIFCFSLPCHSESI